MGKKSLTVWMFVVVVTLSVVVNTAIGKEQTQQELKEQKEQLEEIEEYISRRRREIENCYLGSSTEFQLREEAEIRMLEVADKGVYTPLAAQAEVAETVLQINGYENLPYGRFKATTETLPKPPKRFAVAQSRIAEAKNDIRARFGWGAVDLEKNRRYALTVGLVELEKRLKEDVFAPKPKPTHGVITGILYSKERPSTIIDGQIVHEGDTIHSVKVVKIHRDKIEFEKNGRKWKQKVQEKPEAFWK